MIKIILLTGILAHASVIDIRHKKVLTFTYILLFLTGLLDVSLLSIFGAVVTGLPIFLVALSGGIGGGDVKLSTLCGYCLGGISGLIGTIIGILLALIVMPIKRLITKEHKPYKPFALVPFLSVGYIVVAILGGI